MPKRLERYPIKVDAEGPQVVHMPRRARIVSAGFVVRAVQLYAEVEHDANTAAFDVTHKRLFLIVRPGELVPENGGWVAGVDCFNVYEVRG